MQIDWTPLRHALARHRHLGLSLPIWWRDDDAIAPSAALLKLENTAASLNMLVHLAVIPDLAQDALARAVTGSEHLVPLVHGWRHQNHAPKGEKKAEFGSERSGAADELKRGLEQMRRLFGPDMIPVFVPPWNRIDPCYLTPLVTAGFTGLSTFTPRQSRFAAPGLLQVNTHIDPIDWRGTRDLKDPALLISETVDLMTARAEGHADLSEPLGYLTHHLVHTQDVWDFTRQFLSELLSGGARPHPIAPLFEENK